VRQRTVEERIRSGERNKGRKVPEGNAAEPRIRCEMLRKAPRPAVTARYPRPPSLADAVSREPQEARSETARKPLICNSRDFDWMDRRASSRSTSYSARLASSRTCSPQIASPTGRPWPKLRIVSCPSCSFNSRRIRRTSQRKDTVPNPSVRQQQPAHTVRILVCCRREALPEPLG